MKRLIFLFLLASLGVLLFQFFFKSGYLYQFSQQGSIDLNTLNGKFKPEMKMAIFNNKTLFLPSSLALDYETSSVLGESDVFKRIEIDLTNQRLYAYEGTNQIFNFSVSTGKWGKTPTGVFRIWTKLRFTKMEGGSQALRTYYYLPNVPYTMFFYNDVIPKFRGFGIHGTYWHSNFGHPMSHGCINMKTEEAALLYYWAKPEVPANKQSVTATADNPGTKVIIYGEAPMT